MTNLQISIESIDSACHSSQLSALDKSAGFITSTQILSNNVLYIHVAKVVNELYL